MRAEAIQTYNYTRKRFVRWHNVLLNERIFRPFSLHRQKNHLIMRSCNQTLLNASEFSALNIHIISYHSIHFISASAFVCVDFTFKRKIQHTASTHAHAHIHTQSCLVSTHYHVSQRNREKFKRNSLLWSGYTLAIAMPTTAATATTTTQLYAKEWVTFANIDFSSSFWNCYSSFLALAFEHFISWIQHFSFLIFNGSRIVCD